LDDTKLGIYSHVLEVSPPPSPIHPRFTHLYKRWTQCPGRGTQ